MIYIFHFQNVPTELMVWIVARNVKVGITEGSVYKNVAVQLIIIATIATVVRNVLQELLDWTAAEDVQINITVVFVLRNVIVYLMNIATFKGDV